MRSFFHAFKNREGRCLSEVDRYSYLTRSEGKRSLADLDQHLVDCSVCREDISVLQQMLRRAGEEKIDLPELSPDEIRETLELISRKVQREEEDRKRKRLWTACLGIAAAAAAFILVLASVTINYFTDRKAQSFLARGRSELEQVYESQSPTGLRLDLPFESKAQQRGPLDLQDLKDAEVHFYQALAIKEGLREAHLGLGYVFLNKAQPLKAREEFQRVLDSNDHDLQALLARGASEYEEGLASRNSAGRRSFIEAALADFESVLRRSPHSDVPRYNKILALNELGRHEVAAREIDAYLVRDNQSIWAERLKRLQIRLGTQSTER